jgi:hypothetical protein
MSCTFHNFVTQLEDFTQKEQELTHYFYYLCMREVLRRAKTVVDRERLLDFKPLVSRGEELEMVLIRTVQRRQEIISAMTPPQQASPASSSAGALDAERQQQRKNKLKGNDLKISERSVMPIIN